MTTKNTEAIRQMRRAFLLATSILLVEFVGGLAANSLALLSDAAHMLTDAGAVGLSWIALKEGEKPPDATHTYGFQRAGVLAALVNAGTLVLITLWIGYEAYRRILHPEPVHSGIMLAVAAFGLLANLYISRGMKAHSHDINVRAALLHILGDAAASGGVILGSVVITYTGWLIVDPIISFGIAAIVATGAWRIAKESYGVLMAEAPPDLDVDEVKERLKSNFPAVSSVHDLHVWQLTSDTPLLTCHLVVDQELRLRKVGGLLQEIKTWLKTSYGITHATLEAEPSACGDACSIHSQDT